MNNKNNKLLSFSVLLIIIIVLLVITSLFLFLKQLSNQRTDGTIINIAGRQRMLSQKITKNCLFLSNCSDSLSSLRSKEELSNDLLRFKSNHYLIRNRNNSNLIHAALNEITPNFNILTDNAEKVITANNNDILIFTKQVLDIEHIFLRDMDRIVNMYEAEYNEKQLRFKSFIIVSNIIMVIILISIVIFVIIPEIKKNVLISKKQKEMVKELITLNHTKNTFFKIIAHDLKNPFNSILGFTELFKENFKNYSREEILSSIEIIKLLICFGQVKRIA